jgi:hypothetical protein
MVEHLTYDDIAQRLSITAEAARAMVRRHRLPRSTANDGKTLIAIDFGELRHRKLPARSPGALTADRIVALETELAAERDRSAGHRAAYERLLAVHEAMAAKLDHLEAIRALLETAQAVTMRPPEPALPWWRRWRRAG